MKRWIQWEEAGQLLACVYGFTLIKITPSLPWWSWPLLFLAPDLGILGYLAGNAIGAMVYNLFHHKGVAAIILALGLGLGNSYLSLAGLLLFAHSSFDRLLGYGLKLPQGFQHTHLGMIGKKAATP